MEGKTESHMTSAAAFVEGGIQDSCDDACSICLDEFCESDPSTVTTCKHEFHLQCILEWGQRSSQCPMCWRPISLKDETSQELFEAVEHERNLRANPPRNVAIFRHPAFGDFDLQHLRMGDADFEERIIQHLAAAAAMGRAHHLGRREGQRTRASAHSHPQYVLFSTQPTSLPGHVSAAGGGNEPAALSIGNPSNPVTFDGDAASQPIPHLQIQNSPALGSDTVTAANRRGTNDFDRGFTVQSSPADQDGAGPSDFQSFSDSLRSKLNSISLRYKESISKGARGWKERLFARSSSMSEASPEARREDGVAGVSRLMESHSLQSRGNNRVVGPSSLSNHLDDNSIAEVSNQTSVGGRAENSSRENNTPAACSASSRSD